MNVIVWNISSLVCGVFDLSLESNVTTSSSVPYIYFSVLIKWDKRTQDLNCVVALSVHVIPDFILLFQLANTPISN